MKKIVLLAFATLVLFACSQKKEPVGTEAQVADKEYDKIIEEIKSGMVGGLYENVEYLHKQNERYKEHKLVTEITHEIRKMLVDHIVKKFEKEMVHDFANYDSAIINANTQLFNGNPDKALKIIEPIINEVEIFRELVLADDSATIYRIFYNVVEEGFYLKVIHGDSKRKIYLMPERFFRAYLTYGITLVELERLDEAKTALVKAWEINPVHADVYFELGEISKIQKDQKEFLRLTQEAHKIAYTKAKLARCYRNFGYYFIEQEKFDDAIAMYHASLSFDSTQTKKVLSELDYIQKYTKKPLGKKPSKEQIMAVFKKHNIQYGVDENLYNLIYSLGRALEAEKEYERAKFCFRVLLELTDKKEFKELIEKIDKMPKT
ncbi:MAG: hypothetical protein LBC64_11165 [Fibromonadaceae bacterium]|jgi:tetratricopeptide (TPR) repeat protein|nr:hypothetical protein [Fibromonadaceae bacterium]